MTGTQSETGAQAAHVRRDVPVAFFPALDATGVCRAAFIQRIPGIDVSGDKPAALARLDAVHREVRDSLGLGGWPMLTAQQVHGADIDVIDMPIESDERRRGCDGLICNQRKVVLGVHVADCCAVYLVDPAVPAVGLVHSGKKGTELDIVGRGIQAMVERFASRPSNLVVQLSPCIRPPHYEVDFAAHIREQCRRRGVNQIHDSAACTACNLQAYYSYRLEKGKTGRMLALLALG